MGGGQAVHLSLILCAFISIVFKFDTLFSVGRDTRSGIPNPVRLVHTHITRLSEDMPTASSRPGGSEIGCKITPAVSTPCYR